MFRQPTDYSILTIGNFARFPCLVNHIVLTNVPYCMIFFCMFHSFILGLACLWVCVQEWVGVCERKSENACRKWERNERNCHDVSFFPSSSLCWRLTFSLDSFWSPCRAGFMPLHSLVIIGKGRIVTRPLIGSSRPHSQSNLTALVGRTAVYPPLRCLRGLLDFYA